MGGGSSGQQQPGMHKLFLSGASAACIAEGVTLPLDTAKVRLQLQNLVSSSSSLSDAQSVPPKYRGPIQTVKQIVVDEGFAAPFKGLVPGLHRQFLFTGVRLGLYEPVKRLFFDGPAVDEPIGAKVGAAIVCSAAGITVAQPSDVLKVRFQAHSDLAKRPYSGALHGYRTIWQQEGFFAGLFRGYTPNLLRNCMISSTEIVMYDVAKHKLFMGYGGFQDGMHVHLGSAIIAGFAATCVGSPADVIGTRLMCMTSKPSLGRFCLDIARTEGVGAFYKGFTPNFARLASFNIVLWLSYEHIRRLMGIPAA